MGAFARVLLAGGLTSEEYDTIRDDMMEENRKQLLIYAPVASVVFCLLSIASLFVQQGPPSSNHMIYLVLCLVMGGITLGAHFLDRNGSASRPRLTSVLMYAFMFALNAFSISVSIAHAQYPAVSAIVFLLVNPLLFADRPIRVMAMTVVAAVAVCVSSVCAKSPGIAMDDVWNVITFGLVALAVDVLIMGMKLSRLFQAKEISYLSTTDTLTQLRNRNNYENRLESYPQSGAKVLVCAYADANGLRELNNTKGHDAGDELLRAVARQMRKAFGEKDTYRIGGDEFVSFVPDGSLAEVQRRLQRVQDKVAAKGYSVSCGAAEAEAAGANMRALVRAAEKQMYAQKQRYHANDSV